MELRVGAELVRASNQFAKEDLGLTWRLLLSTLAVYGAVLAVATLAPWWPLQALAMVIAGLTIVRLFIFFHDHLHGAVLTTSPLGTSKLMPCRIWDSP